MNLLGLCILTLLVALHAMNVVELGHTLWLIVACLIVAAAGVIEASRNKDQLNG